MEILGTLQNKIIDFLLSLPNINDIKGRQAFIYSTGLDRELCQQIPFDEPPAKFIPLTVSILLNYGELNDGRSAIETVLEVSKNYIGLDKRASCNTLIQELRAHTKEGNNTEKRIHSPFAILIDEHTQNFVGREFVFEEIDQFLAEYSRGYLIIKGEPGIGKTALMAQLVKTRNYIHHFNIAAQGIRRPDEFLESVCPHLIKKYGLHFHFSSDKNESGVFLNTVLKAVSDRLEETGEKEIIIVDALDEASQSAPGENLLFLPKILPSHIYFVLSARPIDLSLRIDMDEARYYPLEADGKGNLLDVRRYLQQELVRKDEKCPPIISELAKSGISEEEFIQRMIQNSEGNFMYLYHLVKALRRRDYTPLDLNRLPKGLIGYYEDFLRRLREKRDRKEWIEMYKPTLSVLAVMQRAISCSELAEITELLKDYVQEITTDFQEFLRKEKQGGKIVYRIWHRSFQEFLEGKVDKEEYHYRIAEFYNEHTQTWETIQDYSLNYLGYHYFKSGKQGYEKLCRLVEDENFREAKRKRFGVLQRILEDVRYALESALKEDELPRIVQYGFLYSEIKEGGKQKGNVLELARVGEYEKALDRSALYQNETDRFKLMLLVADVAGERGDVEKAEEIVERAVALPNVSLRKEDRWMALKVVEMLVKGDRRGGAELLNKIATRKSAKIYKIKTGKSGELFISLLFGLLERDGGQWMAQNYVQLVKVAEGLSDLSERIWPFVKTARVLLELKQPLPAQELLEKALSLTEQFQDDSDKSTSSFLIAETAVKLPFQEWIKESLNRLVYVVEGIGDDWDKSRALSCLARALGEIENLDWSRKIFQRLINIARGMTDKVVAKSRALSSLSEVLAEIREEEWSREVCQQLIEIVEGIRDEQDKYYALSSLAEALAKIGEVAWSQEIFQHSVMIAEEVENERYKSNVLSSLAKALVRQAKLGMSCGVQVPVGKGLATHP